MRILLPNSMVWTLPDLANSYILGRLILIIAAASLTVITSLSADGGLSSVLSVFFKGAIPDYLDQFIKLLRNTMQLFCRREILFLRKIHIGSFHRMAPSSCLSSAPEKRGSRCMYLSRFAGSSTTMVLLWLSEIKAVVAFIFLLLSGESLSPARSHKKQPPW